MNRDWLRSHHVEVAWGLFAVANYAAMIAWPTWETIPFHFVWISLTLLYGFRVWPMRSTLIVLLCVMTATAVSIGLDAFHGIQLWGELFEVPLMAAMFLAMVWHARRRVDAQRIAEQRADEGRSLLERQERFIQDVSHEMRTPMTIARGHLELLRGQDPEPPELWVALDELERMDAIVERLLVLAKVGQPDFVLRAETHLESLLEDVFMRWSELAPRAWRLGPIAAGTVVADADRLRTALDALIENAVKYTQPHDAIEIRAHARARGTEVSIEVEDEGCGVSREALHRIFDRFARADSARTRAAGGVGLGLAIADAIAKAHGGACHVVSTGDGAVFSLRLPGFTAASQRPASPGAPAAPPAELIG